MVAHLAFKEMQLSITSKSFGAFFCLYFTIPPEDKTIQQNAHLQFLHTLKLHFLQAGTFLQLLQVLQIDCNCVCVHLSERKKKLGYFFKFFFLLPSG